MGYMHIDNLYKDTSVLMLKEVYALEKIDGTSAHVKYSKSNEANGGLVEKITFFSGGATHETFVKLFDQVALLEKFRALGNDDIDVTVYGEAYGGKLQGMSATYGKELRFVAFDVCFKHDDKEVWLDVPNAEDVANKLGLEFVSYRLIPATVVDCDRERDADSVQAIRNGMGPGHIREGVVLRPVVEITVNNDHRVMAKHKRDEFMETKTPKQVDPARIAEKLGAKAVAEDWVTDVRLDHVLDKLFPGGVALDITKTPDVIKSMVEDVMRESASIVVWSKDVGKEVGTKARELYMKRVKKI